MPGVGPRRAAIWMTAVRNQVRCFAILGSHHFARFHASSAECYTETDISYYGNDLNNGTDDIKASAADCSAFCATISDAQYFEWFPLDDEWEEGRGSCWCKTSDSGRIDRQGSISGNTNCLGKKSLLRRRLLQECPDAPQETTKGKCLLGGIVVEETERLGLV